MHTYMTHILNKKTVLSIIDGAQPFKLNITVYLQVSRHRSFSFFCQLHSTSFNVDTLVYKTISLLMDIYCNISNNIFLHMSFHGCAKIFVEKILRSWFAGSQRMCITFFFIDFAKLPSKNVSSYSIKGFVNEYFLTFSLVPSFKLRTAMSLVNCLNNPQILQFFKRQA